jgi:uncharacterized membrane protein
MKMKVLFYLDYILLTFCVLGILNNRTSYYLAMIVVIYFSIKIKRSNEYGYN